MVEIRPGINPAAANASVRSEALQLAVQLLHRQSGVAPTDTVLDYAQAFEKYLLFGKRKDK